MADRDPRPVGDLAHLPKAHLHLHLEGAMRPATLTELAERAGVEVPPVRGFAGFGAFADMYVAASELLLGEEPLRRITREVVEDAHHDGVTWLEPALYSPRYVEAFGSNEAAIEIVLDELLTVGERLGVGTGLIVAADRTVDPAEAVTLAGIAATFAGRGVVGFGLANDEAGHPPEPYADAFAIARDAGLLSVPHGGELDGPSSVIGCLDALGADRIMHGVRAVEDPELLARLADSGVCLDVCLTSNVALGVVPGIADHPLPLLLQAGIACSLNGDDPLLFGPGILEEYELCRARLGLDDRQLAGIARDSLTASGAPRDLVDAAHLAIGSWLAGSARGD